LHVLDLHESGRIEPHIDSVKFTGEGLASLSLVSGSRLRFKEYARQRDPVMCCARNRYMVVLQIKILNENRQKLRKRPKMGRFQQK